MKLETELQDRTVFLVVSGSHAYGMATETSDYDYRGIFIPPMYSYIGLMDKIENVNDTDVYKYFDVGLLKTDPRVDGSDPNEAPDMQLLEISKFIRLALQNNPSVLETLFIDDYVIKHPVMDVLIANREKLLSKSCKARFCGYAISQLRRIEGHRRWLLNPIDHKPTREEFGLPNHSLLSPDQVGAASALIQKELDEFMIDQTHLPEDIKIELYPRMSKMMRAVWSALNTESYPVGSEYRFKTTEDALFWGAAKDQEFSENFLDVLVREKRYRSAKSDWDRYQEWLRNRNEKRAELEKKFGLDTKHASHLVRLLTTCREILTEGKLNVKRSDADELKAIRNGAWTYEQLIEFAEKQDKEMDELVKTSPLPKIPDIKFFDNLVREMILEFNGCKIISKD
jgi:uncharacterized protein